MIQKMPLRPRKGQQDGSDWGTDTSEPASSLGEVAGLRGGEWPPFLSRPSLSSDEGERAGWDSGRKRNGRGASAQIRGGKGRDRFQGGMRGKKWSPVPVI